MFDSRICVIGTAPDELVEACLSHMAEEADTLCLLKRDAKIVRPQKFSSVEFDQQLTAGDSRLRDAFASFAPTDVILVCERYQHDAEVEALVDWSRSANIRPRIHVFLNRILLDGYLETFRKHPAVLALTAEER